MVNTAQRRVSEGISKDDERFAATGTEAIS
jgi:hypothetical protein